MLWTQTFSLTAKRILNHSADSALKDSFFSLVRDEKVKHSWLNCRALELVTQRMTTVRQKQSHCCVHS